MKFDQQKIYYHGTGNVENILQNGFDHEFTGKGNDQYGSGFYFTDCEQTAKGYAVRRLNDDTEKLGGEDAPGVLEVKLKLSNPLFTTGSNINDGVLDLTSKQVRKILDYSDALKRELDAEPGNPAGDHFDLFWETGNVTEAMLKELASLYAGEAIDHIEGDLFDGDSHAFRKALHEVTGFDGVVIEFPSGEQHAVAWFTEQIEVVDHYLYESQDDEFSLR